MAFQTTSRSFTNLTSPTTDIQRNNSATTLTSTLGNGTGPWGMKTSSIWGSNSTFVPRSLATENTQALEKTGYAPAEETNVKKGSGSLLANSDSWRATQPCGDSVIRINTQPLRSNSSIDVPRASSNGSTNISPTTSRAPAINLTNPAFPSTRPSFQSSQASGFFGEQAPIVYPKYKDRPYTAVDSAISPNSTNVSPINERRPQWPVQYRDTSLTSSREQSRAPFDRQHSQPSVYRHRAMNTRTPSISSQSNGSYSQVGAINPEYLPSTFSQLTLSRDDRPVSSRGFDHLQRSTYTDHNDNSQGYNNNFTSPAYDASTTANFAFQNIRSPNSHAFDFRPGQFHDTQSRLDDRQAWSDISSPPLTVARRPTNMQEQPVIDQRLLMALKDQYSLYAPYTAPAMSNPAPFLGYYSLGLGGFSSAMPPQPTDLIEGVQSAKLYDFKLAGKNNRRYELKDIYDHIAEFAGDQHGSRFIQNKLETANSDEKERVFREIEPNAIPLMTDVFGNYVIQKFFDHGHQEHKKILASKMRGQVLNLSTQMYGCRVVQKALEHVLLEQQQALIGELEHHVLKCVKDQNGNHVIQKAIERCPTDTISFVYQAFVGQVHNLSLHPYGCRVIQRCLERQEWFPAKGTILSELHESMPKGMIGDSYGNYVVQHVVENGPEPDRQHVLGIVLSDLEGYSKHKFASNVVEKCIQYSNDVWRRRVVEILTTVDQRRAEGESVLVGLIKDSFGNYVIQKLLDSLSPQDFVCFHAHLQPAMAHAKRTGSGKQVVSIEKKMQRFESLAMRNPAFQLSIPPNVFTSSYGSLSNTPPPLTADSHSIQSSGIPSVNGDAIEGAAMSRKNSEVPIDGMMIR